MRRSSWTLLAVASGLAGACSSGPELVALPETAGFATMVIVYEGEEVGGSAGSVDETPALQVNAGEDVFLLLYRDTLDELRTEPGILDPAFTDRSCRLLEPEESYRLVAPRGEAARFVEIEGPVTTILSDRILDLLRGDAQRDRCERCPEFEVIRIPLNQLDGPTASMPLGDGRALLSLEGRLALLSRSGVEPLACDVDARGLALLPDGRVWVGSKDESVVLDVDLEARTCTVAESWPLPTPRVTRSWRRGLRWARPSPAGSDFELWALTGSGQLWTRTATSWSRAAQLELHFEDAGDATGRGGIEWLGPRYVAVNVSSDDVTLVENGSLRIERPPAGTSINEAANRIMALRARKPGRLLTGIARGQVFERDDGAWSLMPGTPLDGAAGPIGAFVELEHQLVYSVEAGRLVFVHPDRGVCPEVISVPGSRGRGSQMFGGPDGSVVIADFVGTDDVPGEVVWLEPLR